MNTQNEDNAIRAVLRNEATWVIFIIGAVWSMVIWVILPLNNVQKDVAEMKGDISEIKVTIQNGVAKDSNMNDRLTVIETIMHLK